MDTAKLEQNYKDAYNALYDAIMNNPIVQIPSPNHFTGRHGWTPELIVIHIMDGTLQGTDERFSDSASQVSSHYGIGKQGEIHQYVKEEDAAWANGNIRNPQFTLPHGKTNPNYYCVSIENEGHPEDVWTEAQKLACAMLMKTIAMTWNIPLDRSHVKGHSEIDHVVKINCPTYPQNLEALLAELILLANKVEPLS